MLPFICIIPRDRQKFDVGRVVRRAMKKAEIDTKVAADLMEIPEPMLSRWLSGTGTEHIQLDALTVLGDTFQYWFAIYWLEEAGLSADGSLEVAKRGAASAFRMAKATLGIGEEVESHAA